MTNTIRIATRRSRLALWQAGNVRDLLVQAHAGLDVQLMPMTTSGDRVRDRPLAEFGGKGLFVKELERALAERQADIAVHSMKDVPSELPAGMVIGAVLPRANPLDAFVSREHPRLADLPPGARVGTSSPRRQALLRHLRPDLALELVRGNVDTRLKRLDEGTLDAILLACAGLERLGLGTRISEILDADRFVPAVGQGVIGVECRADDTAIRAAVAVLDDPPTAQRIAAERACAQRLHGSCQSPIAAYAALDDGQLLVRGFVGSPDGREAYRDSVRGSSDQAAELGVVLAERLLQAGADDLLERLRASAATAP